MKYFYYTLFLMCFLAFSHPAFAKEEGTSKCELWVTFLQLDKKQNREGYKIIADYIYNNQNLSVISEGSFNVKSFYNYCLDVINDDGESEFDAINKFFITIPKSTGIVKIEIKDGSKATLMK